jgi:ribosome-associated heat shock protein Hsp15
MEKQEGELRIDKWLWAVRIFKTRSMAAQACKKGRVLIDDQQVKPSHQVKVGSVVTVKKKPIFYKYRVLGLLGKRQSASIAREYLEDITPEKEMKKLDVQKQVIQEHRPKGRGRPTKKERRELDKFKRKGL